MIYDNILLSIDQEIRYRKGNICGYHWARHYGIVEDIGPGDVHQHTVPFLNRRLRNELNIILVPDNPRERAGL